MPNIYYVLIRQQRNARLMLFYTDFETDFVTTLIIYMLCVHLLLLFFIFIHLSFIYLLSFHFKTMRQQRNAHLMERFGDFKKESSIVSCLLEEPLNFFLIPQRSRYRYRYNHGCIWSCPMHIHAPFTIHHAPCTNLVINVTAKAGNKQTAIFLTAIFFPPMPL